MAAVPKEPLLNASIVLDGVDFSELANEVNFEDSAQEHDVTGFQGGEYSEETAGLKTVAASIAVFQDYTDGGLHQTVAPIYKDRERFVLVVKPDDEAIATDNPAFCMVGRIYKYVPIGAKVGEPQAQTLEIKNGSKLGFVECVTAKELTEFEEKAKAIIGGSGSGSGSGA